MGRRPLTAREIADSEERERAIMEQLAAQGSPTDLGNTSGAVPPEGKPLPRSVAERNVPQIPVASPGPSVNAPPGTLGVDPRALALQFNPLEELERVRAEPLPDHTDAASRFIDKNGNFLGMPEADELQKAEERSRQAAAEYDKRYGSSPAPQRNWEDEFLRSRAGWEDNTRGREALQTLVNGPDAGRQAREAALRERQDYEDRLLEAQKRNEANAPISRAAAESIAGSMGVSPEAAAALRRGDDVTKAFSSGGYAGRLRERGQDVGYRKHQESLVARGDERDLDRKAGTENTILRGAMGERAALANKNGALSPEQILELKAGMYAQALQLKDPEQGAAVATGNYAGLTPEQVRKAKLLKSSVNFAAESPKVREQVVSNVVKEETARESKQQSAVETSIAKAQYSPDYRIKMETDLNSRKLDIQNAIKAWRGMTDGGRQAFVEWAPSGIPQSIGQFMSRLKNGQQATEDDRMKATALRALMNEVIQRRAGVAVSESEWGRTAGELGLANGSWDPFNSPKSVGDVLNRIAEKLVEHRNIYKAHIPEWGTRPGAR